MSDVQLNWESAEVENSTLSVDLEGEISEEWQGKFQTTAKLLGGGQWEDVEIEDNSVRVGGLHSGDEEKLRHYLESLVSQANASIEAAQSDEEDADSADEDADSKQEDDEQQSREKNEKDEDGEHEGNEDRKDPDSAMTDRFRSFGSERGEDESESGSKSEDD